MQEAVTALLFNGSNILAVSRKHDLNDFGLPGGKVDPGETLEQACIREVAEETGLTITNLRPVFERQDGKFHVTTFMADWSGHVTTTEDGLVGWVEPEVITLGCFGEYNKKLFKAINLYW